MSDHPSNPDQLMARALGVCWHSPTSDRWPCTPTRRCACGSRITHPTETECMNCDGPPFTVDPDRRMPVHVLDEDYLTSYALDQQRDAGPGRYTMCAGCIHTFHGLPCDKYIPIGNSNQLCPCPGAFS